MGLLSTTCLQVYDGVTGAWQVSVNPTGLQSFITCVEGNPYLGTSSQILDLSIEIYRLSTELDGLTFRFYRDKSKIPDGNWSKLKVIGKTLKGIKDENLLALKNALPDRYQTIHCLCGLSQEELVTAVKSKCITRSTTIRDARDYVKRVRFPALAGGLDPEKPQQEIFRVFQDANKPLEDHLIKALEQELQEVGERFGVAIRPYQLETMADLKSRRRAEREVFWRNALTDQLSLQWFEGTPEETRQQFNLKTVEEFHNTPLRQFTGFLIRTGGGRAVFWEKYGRAYVAKLQMEQEKTDDKTRRDNWRRRLEEVFGDDEKRGRDLAIWCNQMWRGSGLI